jgi:hypothetical protein
MPATKTRKKTTGRAALVAAFVKLDGGPGTEGVKLKDAIALALKRWKSNAATPEATLAATAYVSAAKEDGQFEKLGRGVFRLRYIEKPE